MGSSEKFFGDIGLKILKGFVIERDLDPEKIEPGTIHNILVILRHQMGDLVTATPMMRSLKAAYPGSKLMLVTKLSTRYKEIFTGDNSIADEVFEFEHGFEKYVSLVKELRERKIDLAVVPSTVVFSATNHLIAYYSYSKIKVGVKSIDYEDNKISYLLSIKNDFNWLKSKSHQIERNLDIIRQLRIAPQVNSIELKINNEQKTYAESFIRDSSGEPNKPVVCIHPGAAKEGNTWPAEKYAALALRLISECGVQILISEGPLDKKYADAFEAALKEKNGVVKCMRHKGLLMNNLALINISKLFITNDTGVMHLASGLETPVIALFGPTKAYQWGPLGKNKISVQAASSNISDIEADEVFRQCSFLFK